jgi:serine/threonine-protein kinase
VDIIAQLSEALAGRYTLDRELGRGGMATVYLARDVRHHREVAVKVLNPELGAVLGVERFLAEISVTAKLQHPNLLPLFDSGEANGHLFYVMPFVEGESLRARLAREKQLPVDDAVRIAIAVATALDYAHERGVIHRDLKPENILLQHGQPVVADFGIALAISNAGGARVTQTGLSLGTPQYMSPEQATGDRAIDGRTDVYSLGAVLYEMLTGEPPHTGTTAQAIIAKLMTEEPRAVTALRRTVPGHVELAVQRALHKLPADRWKSAREFADALSGAVASSFVASSRAPSVQRSTLLRVVPWVIAAAATVVAAIVIRRPAATSSAPTLRFPLALPDSERLGIATGVPFAISPDERSVAYVAIGPAATRIIIRGLDDMVSRVVPNSDGAIQPQFSSDGKWISFITAGNVLVKEAVGGGPVTTILPMRGSGFAGAVWVNADTMIASVAGALIGVPSEGGTPVVVSRPDSAHDEVQQWGPQPAPHGYFAYISVPHEGPSGAHLAILDARRKRTTITAFPGTTVLGAVDDRLVWLTPMGVVMSAKLDPNGVLGAPRETPLEMVLVGPGGAAKAMMTAHGTLIYRRGLARRQLMSVDATSASALSGSADTYSHPRWSPDGRHIAVVRAGPRGPGVLTLDARDGTATPVSRRDETHDAPAWTPDGRRLLMRDGDHARLVWLAGDGTDTATTLVPLDDLPWDGTITRDAKWIVFRTAARSGRRELMYAPLTGTDRTAKRLVSLPGDALSPSISPDGKWVAFTSFENGRYEIYACPLPGPGAVIKISADGGLEPLWSADGTSIYYRGQRVIMAADVTVGQTLTVLGRRKVFDDRYIADPMVRNYDLSPDGKHFLMLQEVDRQVETIIVYNWASELRRSWR